VTTRINFNTDSDIDGQDVWNDLTNDGRLTQVDSASNRVGGLHTASCVCITSTVEPHSMKTAEFALAWHMPEVVFGLKEKKYLK
jgi:hypothetical protein